MQALPATSTGQSHTPQERTRGGSTALVVFLLAVVTAGATAGFAAEMHRRFHFGVSSISGASVLIFVPPATTHHNE